MATKIAVTGATGRMGRRIMALVAADPDAELVQAIEYEGHPAFGRPVREIDIEADSDIPVTAHVGDTAEVLIDFSTPEATALHAAGAARKDVALVVGTTGLDDTQAEAVQTASASVPLIHAPNFSLGVNLVFRVAAEVAKALGEDFDIEIAEAHHNRKADAPSGTALRIAETICNATGRAFPGDLVHGREGKPGPRTRREIGMHALRLGSVVGDHTVHYGSDFERIELTHRAQTRDVFAAGAVRAAKWLAGKEPGTYSMDDVLFG